MAARLIRHLVLSLLLCAFVSAVFAQPGAPSYLLQPDRVFDGQRMHEDWVVLVRGEQIAAAGPANAVERPEGGRVIELPGMTLLPGLIEGHAHLFLYPYDQTAWTDQVLHESEAYRVARATVHARETLAAGVTTVRDLGTEGAGYADAGLKRAIEDGVIPGPRLLIASRALVATGSYGPTGFKPSFDVPLGAEPADGVDALVRAVRDQIGKGADLVKVYADYRWGPDGEARPTFTQEELNRVVAVARSSGRPVVAHASTAEAMRRATLAGVETIEHGDGGTPEVFRLMAEHEVALCPTLAAAEAIEQYRGWQKGGGAAPRRIRQKHESFRAAREAGVTICFGGDVGVYPHGDNAREIELMVEYGMTPREALRAATSVNAQLFHLDDELGRVEPGLLADLIAVPGNPMQDVRALREVRFVMKGGTIVKQP